ncbi:MAG TPA: hypothetical protein VGG39_02010 [Polyangiaceae bacterium]
MSFWLALGAAVGLACLVACAVLLLRRVRVHARVKAKASAEGTWSAAAGGAVGPIAFTAGASPGGTQWMAHVFGRRIARGTRVPKARRPPVSASRAWSLATSLFREVRFDRLDAIVHGTAGDPATNAQVMGLLTAASATFAPRANITTDVDWLADGPFVDVDCDLEASFVPLRLGWDLARTTWMRRSA